MAFLLTILSAFYFLFSFEEGGGGGEDCNLP